MLLLMGRKRIARVAGFGRYSRVLATVGGSRSCIALLTPATSSASLAGAAKAWEQGTARGVTRAGTARAVGVIEGHVTPVLHPC
jgi:hypothetical protein